MRSTVVLAIAVAGVSLAACRFDREPLGRGSSPVRGEKDSGPAASPDVDAAAEAVDSGGSPGLDGTVSADTGAQDASVGPESQPEAGPAPEPDAGPVVELDAGSLPVPPVVPPMTGGLSCAGTFCAFGVDPEKPCCTTAADVTQHTAREVDRCGLDLSAFAGAPYGTGCWQRDQLGIVDARCPDRPAADGVAAEPGCCSDDGSCGTINGDHKLGCRYEPGSAPRACAPEPPAVSCDPTGTFAVRFRVDATWGGRMGSLVGITDDGRGMIDVLMLLRIDGVDAETEALETNARFCGVTLPLFYSTTLCEAYQPIFAPEIWNSRALPVPRANGRYECAANGCVLSIDPFTYLLGFSMTNPEAPWPQAGMLDQLRCREGSGERCFPDHDADDRAGVSVTLPTEGTIGGGRGCRDRYRLRAVPLSASIGAIFGGVRRADRLALGVRTKLGGAVRLADDCDSAHGLAIAEYVNSRAAGCVVEPGTNAIGGEPAGPNDRCQPAEEEFIDANLPFYEVLATGEVPSEELELPDVSPSRGPEMQLVRLGDAAAAVGCEDVLGAAF